MATITASTFDRALQDMAALRARTQTLQTQIASGTTLTRGSDDPLASARLRELVRADTLAAVDTSNAKLAASDLTLTDDALSSFVDAIGQAKTLAQQAANGTLTTAQRTGIGNALLQLHDRLFNLANAQDSTGHALFGGDASGAAYMLNAAGSAVYAGGGSAGTLPLGEGQTVIRGLTGPEFLNFTVGGVPTDLLAEVKALGTALTGGSATPAAAANAALGTFDTALDTVTTQQAVVGARLAWIDSASQRHTALTDQRATTEADLGGTDLAGTIAELQSTMTVLEASQASFARISSLTLFDHLR